MVEDRGLLRVLYRHRSKSHRLVREFPQLALGDEQHGPTLLLTYIRLFLVWVDTLIKVCAHVCQEVDIVITSHQFMDICSQAMSANAYGRFRTFNFRPSALGSAGLRMFLR